MLWNENFDIRPFAEIVREVVQGLRNVRIQATHPSHRPEERVP